MSYPRVTLRVERALLSDGAQTVAGMDEVGRGALAGPVSVGVVLVTADSPPAPRGLADSKQLTAEVREQLVVPVRRWAHASAVGHASAAEIDEFGLTRALRLAGSRALEAIAMRVDIVLLDGSFDWLTAGQTDQSRPTPRVITQVKADGRCSSVAAASVLAKVERDGLLTRLAADYPHYGFERHKGYAVPEHLEALATHGPSPVHRKTWRLPSAR